MDGLTTILEAVSTIGFPIICCLIMFKNNKDMQESHKEEISSLKTCIENNTIQITKLYEKIDALFDTLNSRVPESFDSFRGRGYRYGRGDSNEQTG